MSSKVPPPKVLGSPTPFSMNGAGAIVDPGRVQSGAQANTYVAPPPQQETFAPVLVAPPKPTSQRNAPYGADNYSMPEIVRAKNEYLDRKNSRYNDRMLLGY